MSIYCNINNATLKKFQVFIPIFFILANVNCKSGEEQDSPLFTWQHGHVL